MEDSKQEEDEFFDAPESLSNETIENPPVEEETFQTPELAATNSLKTPADAQFLTPESPMPVVISPAPAVVPPMSPVDDPRMWIINKDTGERTHIEEADRVIPQSVYGPRVVSPASDSDVDPTRSHTNTQQSVLSETKSTKEGSRFEKFFSSLRNIVSRKKNQRAEDIPKSTNWVPVEAHHKPRRELTDLCLVQRLHEHSGAVWVMEFSKCGYYLATAGQDTLVRVWRVIGAPEMDRGTGDSDAGSVSTHGTPLPTDHSINSGDSFEGQIPLFELQPYKVYPGHTGDVLDLAWSSSNFLLSASMDKTVRLWHLKRDECLCVFQHIDFVTTVDFNPADERYFLSGSLDEKLRYWSIAEKKVVNWTKTKTLVTAATFTKDGSSVICGLYNGMMCFYQTEGLRMTTTIHVRSSRGKNSKGKKITGIKMSADGDYIMVTSADSRIRMYKMSQYLQTQKFLGFTNEASQIRASFSEGGEYVICASEDKKVYVWNTHGPPDEHGKDVDTALSHRNDAHESFALGDVVVTAAIFVPHAARELFSQTQIRIIPTPTPIEPLPVPPAGADDQPSTAATPPPVVFTEEPPAAVLHPEALTPRKDTLVGAMIVTAEYNGEMRIFHNSGYPRRED